MNTITLNEAVEILSKKMREDSSWRRYYYTIVKVLQVLFDEEDIEKAFQLNLSEEEIVNYAKETVLKAMGGQITLDDIYEVKILSNKNILIRANGHFYPDESYSCHDIEKDIAGIIKIFTGYSVDIKL